MGKRNKNKSAMKTTDNNVKKKDEPKPKIPFHKAKELSDLVSNLFNGEYYRILWYSNLYICFCLFVYRQPLFNFITENLFKDLAKL